MSVELTIRDRAPTHGDFAARSKIEQALVDVMECSGGWHRLKPFQKSAARMIAVKLSRILNGNPDYIDHWTDLGGYSESVARELGGNNGPQA